MSDLNELSLIELVEYVKDKQVEISVTWEPGHTEMTVQPWRPYKPMCPYGCEPRETDH